MQLCSSCFTFQVGRLLPSFQWEDSVDLNVPLSIRQLLNGLEEDELRR